MKKHCFAYAAAVCVLCINILNAQTTAVTSADFANAWNAGGAQSINVVGAPIDSAGNYGIILANTLNAFGGTSMSIDGGSGTALVIGNYGMVFSPGWNNGLSATLSNLSIYGATNGAVSFLGNGIGAHILNISNTYFYGNAGQQGGAVNVQSQEQSIGPNSYILTNNNFTANSSQNGGAVYMASNNIIFSAANTFSITGTSSQFFSLNKSTGNGGAIYFLANNAQGGGLVTFTAQGYTYYQNSAANLGGAIYNSVLNGNSSPPDKITVNTFDIIGGTFTQNQAGGGGAIATSVNGGNTNVNANIDGKFYSNLSSGNGGAVYNAVGDQNSPYGGAVNFNIKGPFESNKAVNGGAVYNNIQTGQANVAVNILSGSGFSNNYASGNGGAIYNTAGNINGGSAVVEIADGTNFFGNGAGFGGAIYNTGNGIINLNTAGGGISFDNNYSAQYQNGADIYMGSSAAVINIKGTGIVDINDGIAGASGAGTINQDSGTFLNLGADSNNFYYTGVYNLAAGATLNSYGLMFGGQNNIRGTANITSAANSFYFNANMYGGSVMNYNSNSTGRVSIGPAANTSSPGITFQGSGAEVKLFNQTSQSWALYQLEGKIDNGQSNSIEFHSGDVTFGSTDFTGDTNYIFYDRSIINLAGSSPAAYSRYNFTNLATDTSYGATSSMLSIRVGDDPGYLTSDTINVDNNPNGGIGIVGLARVYVNDTGGVLNGLQRVIYGNALYFNNGSTQYVATANATYQVTAVNDQYIQFNTLNSVVTNPGGGTTSTNPGGGSTTTNTDPNGNGDGSTSSTTTNPGPGGGTITTVTNPDGSTDTTITDDNGTTTIHTDQDGNTTINLPGGGSPITIPDGGNSGGDIGTGGGSTINVTTDPGGDIITVVTVPDGNGGSTTTTVTTDPAGGGSSVTNPDGSTNGTTTGPGGSTGNTTAPPPALVLNDVNFLTGTATALGMNTAAARAWQVGAAETYLADIRSSGPSADLDDMAQGTFSVHGANSGARTSILDGDAHSMFKIVDSGISFTLEDLTVQNAYSAGSGSVLNMNNAGSAAILTNLLIQNNSSALDGGALKVLAGSVTSTYVDYYNNKALGGDGGAVYNAGTTSKYGGSFIGNTASGDGGAVYSAAGGIMYVYAGDCAHSAYGQYGSTGLCGMNITGNNAGGLGGAIYLAPGSTIYMASAAGADMILDNNTDSTGANDIYIDNGAVLNFTSTGGTFYVGSGFAGDGTINKYSPVVLELAATGDNSKFTGDFNQYNGIVNVDTDKFFGGTSTISTGILNWNAAAAKEDTAALAVTGGTINIKGTLLLNNSADIIGPSGTLNLFDTGRYEINGGTIFLKTTDMLVTQQGTYGTAAQTDGYLVISGQDMLVYSGAFAQTGGVILLSNQATGYLNQNTPSNGLFGGDLIVSNATVLAYNYTFDYDKGVNASNPNKTAGNDGNPVVPTNGNLGMGDNALFDSRDGALQTHNFAGKFGIISMSGQSGQSTANFAVDLDTRNFISDQLVFAENMARPGDILAHGNPDAGTDGGGNALLPDILATDSIVMLSSINLLNFPTTDVVPFNILLSPDYDPDLIFAASADKVKTPVGTYGLFALGAGNYELRLLSISPDSVRGQASVLAMLGGQLLANNVLFEHVFFDSNVMLESGNKCDYRFLPSQFLKENRQKNLWFKSYYEQSKMTILKDESLSSNLYGYLMGLDFEAKDVGADAYFMPSVYVGYTGADQGLGSTDMHQNALQAGVMLSYMKEAYTASALAYGGVLQNRMEVSGFKDDVNNWFAGAALKNAYNMYLDNFVIQPNVFVSYNVYGKQKWNSDYGDITIQSDLAQGLNISPGVNLIYGLKTWNFLLGGSYMLNMGNKVSGKAGAIDLPEVDLGSDYFEYEAGVSKIFSQRLNVWAKALYKTKRDSDFGVRLGAGWRF